MRAVQLVTFPDQAALKIATAAKYLGICPNTLRKRTDLGLVPARLGENGERIYLLRELDAYLNSLPSCLNGDTAISCRLAKIGRKGKASYL
jgi:hypothetical protein